MRTAALRRRYLGEPAPTIGVRIAETPWFGAFEIPYRPDGRPAGGTLDTAGVPRECQAALAARGCRIPLRIRPELIVAGEKQWVIVPVDKDFIACVGGLTNVIGRLKCHGTVKPPQVRREVNPTYPEGVKRERGLQGTVHLDAIVSKTGCIISNLGRAQPAPGTHSAAVEALSRWRFSPARIGGNPVLVSIKAEMSFSRSSDADAAPHSTALESTRGVWRGP